MKNATTSEIFFAILYYAPAIAFCLFLYYRVRFFKEKILLCSLVGALIISVQTFFIVSIFGINLQILRNLSSEDAIETLILSLYICPIMFLISLAYYALKAKIKKILARKYQSSELESHTSTDEQNDVNISKKN